MPAQSVRSNHRGPPAGLLPRTGLAAVSLHAWVVTGGEPPDPDLLAELAPPQLVVAADSGADVARSLGMLPDVIVGDFDSVSAEGLAAVGEQRRFPVDKDATDLALALAEARDRGAGSVSVVGGSGGRLDHFLANVAALTCDDLAPVSVDALMGPARLWVVRGRRTISGKVGQVVTLLACGGPAIGVRTTGLAWALEGETLEPGSTRGVSNVLEAPAATVTVGSGLLLAIRP